MKTILMVDDEPDFQTIVRRILEPAGFRVLSAGSSEEALPVLGREAVDLLIVDWNLPGKSGVELCRGLRADARLKGLPLMLLTVRNLPDEQMTGLTESGADVYMTKPIQPEELLARIQSFLGLLEG
jgi:DNA-binding response OmpR family regulator